MTENELREIVESEGLSGMLTSIFTKNRVYFGRVARINVKTLMLMDPRIKSRGEDEIHEIMATPSIAETAHAEGIPGAAHKYVAIAIDHIEAIGF